jgi:predicted RNase H-like HicB family nuclease
LANIKEAVQAYVGALEADGLPVPEERFDARLVNV